MTATVSKRATFAHLAVLLSLIVTLGWSATTAHAARHTPKPAREARVTVVRGELDLASMQRARSKSGVIRVAGSPGGSGAGAMELGRASGVVIDGTCNSACAWAFVSNPRACYTSRASFGFHAAHDPGTGRRMGQATDYWLNKVHGALRNRLDGLRTTSRPITVNAAEMSRYLGDRACGGGSRVASR